MEYVEPECVVGIVRLLPSQAEFPVPSIDALTGLQHLAAAGVDDDVLDVGSRPGAR